MKKIDLAGQIFGRLTVLKQGAHKGRFIRWICVCECGNRTAVFASALRSGNTTSCGCFHLEELRTKNTTHGGSYSPEFKAWSHAKSRCFDKKDKKFKYYGGRGISMCEEWRNDFAAFLAHIGPRPRGKTLDRIDTNGNYEPGNVRWATHFQQCHNRRTSKANRT